MTDYVRILRERFGFESFRPGQQEVIEALIEKHAALAVFPTGAGKSLCYELPALLQDGVTLVVSPLIALMKNQIDFLRSRGIEAARLDSSLSPDEIRAATSQMRMGKLKLLYVAPERFNNERFVETMRRQRIALFAIDEAHCISEWGHNFRPDYLKLAQLARELKAERVLALTATATPAVVQNICAGFGIPADCAIVTGFYRPNLSIWTTPVHDEQRDLFLLNRLSSRPRGTTIVYVTLQKTAERVAAMLHDSGYPARCYHAGMESDERTSVQEWWMASESNIVVATIAFGMGIDKADVRYVYHYNLPKSLESYSQEIGRAGRDGLESTVEMLACPDDVPTLENFAYGDTPSESSVRRLIDHLLSQDEDFDVSLYELAGRLDIRQLVLRTALTYLELLGILRQRTPLYGSYKIQPAIPLDEIVAKFDAARGNFIRRVFGHAKLGRSWYTLDVTAAARYMSEDRARIVRALEYLESQNWAKLDVADVRHQFTILRRSEDPAKLAATLNERFARREIREIERIQQVLELVTCDGCQSNALASHFGEKRDTPCGHCSWCRLAEPRQLPRVRTALPDLDWSSFDRLRASDPEALGDPRQAARFLCGISSPASTRAKLHKHRLFGIFESCRFLEVLQRVELSGD